MVGACVIHDDDLKRLLGLVFGGLDSRADPVGVIMHGDNDGDTIHERIPLPFLPFSFPWLFLPSNYQF
jgi:hypothetical protein